MLSVSALMTAANTMAAAVFSPSSCHTPSRNPCMVRVATTRYRNDPYNFRVLPPSPMAAQALAAATPTMTQTFTTVAATRKPTPVMPVAPVAASPIKMMMHCSPAPIATSGYATTNTTNTGGRKMATTGSTRFAVVDFKHSDKTFVAPFKISVGDVVVVEGDRGENIGTVSEISTEVPSFGPVSCKVVRKATAHDFEQLADQRAKEAAAVQTCQTAVESLHLKATVVDCEFQFDLNKLSIFVERPTRKTFVDFRKLQRGLFRDFRCRIWLNYMDEVEAARAEPRRQ